MNANAKDALIQKIQKLRAMAGSANENEAAAFAAKVQELLIEHALTEADIVEKDDRKDESIVIEAGGVTSAHPWRRPLAQAVAEMYFCKYFYTKHGSNNIHSFVGARHNVEVAKMMFEYLHTTVDRLAKEGAKGLPESEKSPYRTTFRATATQQLYYRIHKRINEAKQGTIKTSTGTTLPAILDLYKSWNERNDAFLADKFGKMRSSQSRLANLHGKGAADGHAAGRSIGLDAQVAGGKRKLLK